MKKNFKFLEILNILTRQEKIYLVIVFLFSFFVVFIESFGVAIIPIVFIEIINAGSIQEIDKIPSFLTNIFNFFSSKYNLIIFIILLFFFKSLINYIHYIFEFIILKRIRIRLNNEWYSKTISQNYLDIQNTPIAYKIWFNAVIDIATGIISNYLNLAKGIVFCVSIFLIVIFLSSGNLFAFYFIILFTIILFYLFFSKKLSKFGKLMALAAKEKLDVIQATFTGIKNIIIYKKQKYFFQEFSEKNTIKEKNLQKNTVIQGLPTYFLEFIGILFISIYFIINLHQNTPSSELIFNIGLISYGSLRILSFFKVVTHNFSQIRSRKFDVKKLIEQFKSYKEKNPNLNSFKYSYNVNLIDNVILKIKNINFGYNEQNLLKISNYEFYKNKFYIIIGESGSGKSSFLDLMLEILEPNKGEISYAIEKKKIGYVSQETFLLNTSLKKNIAFAENENSIDENKIFQVLKKVNLENFVLSSKEKLNLQIQNNGFNMSVGQKQRIGIARALYFDPEIIFLDEPTSSLDEENEIKFIKTLNEIKKDKTIIMVIHKYQNIKGYDKILEIKNGELKEKNE